MGTHMHVCVARHCSFTPTPIFSQPSPVHFSGDIPGLPGFVERRSWPVSLGIALKGLAIQADKKATKGGNAMQRYMKYEKVEEGMSRKCGAEMSPGRRFLGDGTHGRNNRALHRAAGGCDPAYHGASLGETHQSRSREAEEARTPPCRRGRAGLKKWGWVQGNEGGGTLKGKRRGTV